MQKSQTRQRNENNKQGKCRVTKKLKMKTTINYIITKLATEKSLFHIEFKTY